MKRKEAELDNCYDYGNDYDGNSKGGYGNDGDYGFYTTIYMLMKSEILYSLIKSQSKIN